MSLQKMRNLAKFMLLVPILLPPEYVLCKPPCCMPGLQEDILTSPSIPCHSEAPGQEEIDGLLLSQGYTPVLIPHPDGCCHLNAAVALGLSPQVTSEPSLSRTVLRSSVAVAHFSDTHEPAIARSLLEMSTPGLASRPIYQRISLLRI